MKILVPIKRVVDYNVKVRVKSDNSAVDLANVKMSMNPFDEIATEEACRIKEKNPSTEILAVSMGVDKCQEVIRTAMAMGADRGIHVLTDIELQPLSVAKLLAAIINDEKPDLVLMGKQAIDDDFNQTGQMLAALLNWPQACFASKITLQNNKATVEREVDSGTDIIEVNLPTVITVDLRLNEPRYPALPNIMKARTKPLITKTPKDYNIDVTPRITTVKVEEPSKRTAGIKVANAAELVQKLKDIGAL